MRAVMYATYNNLNLEALQEIYQEKFYRKLALQTMSDENITLGALSTMSIIISLLAMIISIWASSVEGAPTIQSVINKLSLRLAIVVAGVVLSFQLLLGYRLRTRAKKIVYCDFALKVVEDIIEQKEKVCEGQNSDWEL